MSDVRKKTKRRLLAAARGVFAEHGYEAATVQMIVAASQANIAAGSYHFGSKANLYAAVVAAEMEEAMKRMPRLRDAEDDPERQLRKFIGWFFERYEADSVLKGFTREVLLRVDDFQPFFVEQVVARELKACEEILQAMLPAGTSRLKVQRWLRACIALCTGPVLGMQMQDLSRLQDDFQQVDLEGDPVHIADMLVDAIAAERGGKKGSGGKKKKKRKQKQKGD